MPWVRGRNFQKGSRGNLGEVEVFLSQENTSQHVSLGHVKYIFSQKVCFSLFLQQV